MIVVTLIAIATARGSSSPIAVPMRISYCPMIAKASRLPPTIRHLARICHRSWSPLPHDYLCHGLASRRVHAASLDDPLCSDGDSAWTTKSTKPKIANDCLGDGHRRDGVVVWIGIT